MLQTEHSPEKELTIGSPVLEKKDGEPINSSIVTIVIAFVFVALGDVNAVASIISMFFMITYGSLCLISFLNHFGASPSYRPSFKSKWILSLIGFLVSVWVMFKISTPYALIAFVAITLIYLYLSYLHKSNNGFASIFSNALFQLNRNLQVFLQNKNNQTEQQDWRPSAICISKDSFKRDKALYLLGWISHKYGFGTYLHHIEGFYSKKTVDIAEQEVAKLMNDLNTIENHVYIDSIISPSNTSAIAQAIQIPGIAGMENNMVIFEYDKENPENLTEIVDNFRLVNSGKFDICVLASGSKSINYKQGIHVWIKSTDTVNSNLLILLSFIIQGHPDWQKSEIKIFDICEEYEVEQKETLMKDLVQSGRLHITEKNIEVLIQHPDVNPKTMINERSKSAGLTLIGLREETLRHQKEEYFNGYEELGTTLFVYSNGMKKIE